MPKARLKRGIEKRAKTNLQIAQELTEIVEFLIDNGYVPKGPAIKTPVLKSQCSEATYYRVERLVNELGMVQKYSKGPGTYLIHTRKDEIVNGQGVSAMVNEELRRVMEHAKKDSSVRKVVANSRGNPPSQALKGLMQGNFAHRREKLEIVVNAIKASNVKQGDYGKIIFRTPANLYRASPLAVQLYQ